MSSEITLSPEEKKKEYLTYEDFPESDLLTYAGIDCLVTSDLATKLFPEIAYEPPFMYFNPNADSSSPDRIIKKQGKAMSILDSYIKYTTPAHSFLLDLEINGLEYDIDLNVSMKKDMEIELAGLEDQIKGFIKTPFNFDSGSETAAYLYGTLGMEVLSFTKTKEPSTDGDALKELAAAHPEHSEWMKLLIKRNDIASVYRTFVRTYVEDFVKADGRVHPSYNQHGTSSFRISGSDPNLTQLPRPKHGYNIRRMFKVKEGYVFMAFDFSSAEVKILGALSKDPSIAKAIREGLDFHAFSASSMFGVEYEVFMAVLGDPTHVKYKEFKEHRQISKVLKQLGPRRVIYVE